MKRRRKCPCKTLALKRTASGILPSQAIEPADRWLARSRSPSRWLEGQVQPASLDLRLGTIAYRVRASFLPGPGDRVQAKLDDLRCTRSASARARCSKPAASISCRCSKAWRCRRRSAAANPKSSTGRLDVFTRVIADGVGAFDQIPAGYAGRSMPRSVRRRSRSSCARARGCRRSAFARAAADSDTALRELQLRERLVSDAEADISAVSRCRSISPATRRPRRLSRQAPHRRRRRRHGRRATRSSTTGSRSTSRRSTGSFSTPTSSTFSPRRKRCTCRRHRLPRWCRSIRWSASSACTTRASWIRALAMRPAGGKGARVVLEVRSHKVPFILEDGQTIGRLVYERLTETPKIALRPRSLLQLPGAGPEAVQAFQVGFRPSALGPRCAGSPAFDARAAHSGRE